jgi:hypothetical protein
MVIFSGWTIATILQLGLPPKPKKYNGGDLIVNGVFLP